MIRKCCLFVFIMFFAFFGWETPGAEEMPPAEETQAEEKPLWEAGVGVAGMYLPDYRGSDEGRFYALPYPYVVYRGDIFRVDKERVSGRIFETSRMLLDVSFYGGVPVSSDKNDARRGMPDLDPTFEVGPSLRFNLLQGDKNSYNLTLTVPVRAVFSTDFHSIHHEGWILSPRLNFDVQDIIPRTGIGLGISAGPYFATKKYHDYYYTVDSAYATPSRPAYDSKGGYSGSSVTVGLHKQFGTSFLLNAFVSGDFMRGAEIENSPLVTTKQSFMTGAAITWIPFVSATKVTKKTP
ncbi:MAG: MipA/OmpV family protein [Syntrophobacterales bacterium]|jgi:outer membrane scaffolding protein for murein synthesis (MipA/OmpV family)|nr:MipA/OmpV family protein [Syntrophobacterales bacterium]